MVFTMKKMKITKFLYLLIPTSVCFLTPNFVVSHSFKNNLNQNNSDENALSNNSGIIFKQNSIDLTEAKFNDWNYINNINQEYNDDWSKRVYDVAISSVGSSSLFSYQNTYNGDVTDSSSSVGIPSNPKETIFSLLLDSIDWEQMFPGDIESKNLSQKNCYFVITDAPVLGINGGFLLNYKLYLKQVEKIKDNEGQLNTVISQNKEVLIKSNTLILKGFKTYTKDDPKWNNANINLRKNVFSYNDLPFKLNDNFQDLATREQTNILNKAIKDNWTWFFEIKNGVYSINTDEQDIFLSSLEKFQSYFNNVITGVTKVDTVNNKIDFYVNYVEKITYSAGVVDIQNTSSPKLFTIDNYLITPKKGMELTQIIGIAMCLGGGVLLLIAMIILLVKKSKVKEEDIKFNTITGIVPSEYTNYIISPNTQNIEQYQQNHSPYLLQHNYEDNNTYQMQLEEMPSQPQLENFYQTEEEQYENYETEQFDNPEITEEINYDSKE